MRIPPFCRMETHLKPRRQTLLDEEPGWIHGENAEAIRILYMFTERNAIALRKSGRSV
ncbi:hypothetical protein SELSPUOL_01856 [Selenomonas sputigena ATCC 35185]|uniref:Uncharacterized protein n=1 Tax=Selenomonas sputigena (strain ATCC 35185 / DSM 20758 / CCUG 44933 / VPI D19B-28) TaxID=546271 RepID=C9LWK1_SELS3|nr:hypothetical protein SELSPUOL_01856 [Selenomonas sputigena ATCC 35185]